MSYADFKKCEIEGRELLHGQSACLKDKCIVCNDGKIEENYENVYGGAA